MESYYSENGIEVGLDEAGRGTFAGPVVAAAVILPKDFNYRLIKDSKKMSESDRKKAFRLITSKAIAIGVGTRSSTFVDENNILIATFACMHDALDQIREQGHDFDRILVDGNMFEAYHGYDYLPIPQGDDKYYSMAAASVIAKVTRDKMMNELHKKYPEFDWKNNKGYGSARHQELILENGITPEHRLTYMQKFFNRYDVKEREMFEKYLNRQNKA